MERLTYRGKENKAYCDYETRDIINKLAEYEDAEEQGLLLRLPCKVGDTVFKPNPITNKEIVKIKIESIFITESKVNISGHTTKMKYSFCCSPSDFGKTVFLTEAEAEQKLNEVEYQIGKADAIDEFMNYLCENCKKEPCYKSGCREKQIAEQLKERKLKEMESDKE